jgi:hypothetical protein
LEKCLLRNSFGSAHFFYFFRMMKKLSLLLLFFILGCSFSEYPRKWEEKGIALHETKAIIKTGEKGKKLKVMYTGCGGVVIDNGSEAIATDPYFSNQPFMNIQLGKIWTKPEAVASGLQSLNRAGIDVGKIKHVFIEHSHYDHLMDVPWLLSEKVFNDSVKIYGGETTYNILKPFLRSNFVNVDTFTHHPKNLLTKTGKWIQINSKVRVLPIESSHAPHFLKIEMMSGEVGERGIEGLSLATDTTKATRWKRGNVYSYLFDFLSEGKIEQRIFIQSSSCEFPYGVPPSSELAERKVDVAFIGVASAQNVKDYPQSLIKLLNPEKIVLIHWEDFFLPYGRPPKTVRFTNFNRFFKRLSKAMNLKVDQMKGKVLMPKPGMVLEIEY